MYELLSDNTRDARDMLNYEWDYTFINSYINAEREKSLGLISSVI